MDKAEQLMVVILYVLMLKPWSTSLDLAVSVSSINLLAPELVFAASAISCWKRGDDEDERGSDMGRWNKD